MGCTQKKEKTHVEVEVDVDNDVVEEEEDEDFDEDEEVVVLRCEEGIRKLCQYFWIRLGLFRQNPRWNHGGGSSCHRNRCSSSIWPGMLGIEIHKIWLKFHRERKKNLHCGHN